MLGCQCSVASSLWVLTVWELFAIAWTSKEVIANLTILFGYCNRRRNAFGNDHNPSQHSCGLLQRGWESHTPLCTISVNDDCCDEFAVCHLVYARSRELNFLTVVLRFYGSQLSRSLWHLDGKCDERRCLPWVTAGSVPLFRTLKVRTHDATLRATCQLHRVSTSEIVARNIARNAARVEASSTSATLQATIAPCSRFAQHCTQCRDVTNWNRPIRAPVKFCACRGKNEMATHVLWTPQEEGTLINFYRGKSWMFFFLCGNDKAIWKLMAGSTRLNFVC